MFSVNRRGFLQRAAGLLVAAGIGRAGGDGALPLEARAEAAPGAEPARLPIRPRAAALMAKKEEAAKSPPAEPWNELPIRALSLYSPFPQDVAAFCAFVRDALPKEGVNTLVVMFDYRCRFVSQPDLPGKKLLSLADVRTIAAACREAGVTLIPEMNLLAHQSEQIEIGPLLAKYPQLDESPDLNPPNPWRSGGEFDFYSKCLCPRHPDLFPIIGPMMDELIDACGASAFHVGLDEAWIVAHPQCPRCGGSDPAEVFAEYVTRLHTRLASKKCRMWMWSDRLIDANKTGLFAWQASRNNTHRAIDQIPKDIMICDWKYEDAPPTPSYFAVKGFDVLPSSCYNAGAALGQLEQVYLVRKNASRAFFSPTISSRMPGVFATTWMNAQDFIDTYYAKPGFQPTDNTKNTVDTFKRLFAEIRKNSSTPKAEKTA
ncbi:hypothetical protein CCAX7_10570 [Capsulimonas corticalis]|uniref:Glycoside hydrolase family 20 catalytic domain-containing protein n=1 Tax=Capsulimonas corticalis TaxID=2219043 RepID=A0A402CUJ9_9BACT|nr:family 20 glycosylhydrolase [Capsulimonas corticalis]BDI29006.1 hypothetical protein CCAX7_10570 [Capsulimonas corticalis]